MDIKISKCIAFTIYSLLFIGILLSPNISFGQSNSTLSLTNGTASHSTTLASIKRFASFSPLTITPSIVQSGKAFSVTGKLSEYQSGKGLGGERISFRSVPPLPESFISTVITNSTGYFKADLRGPNIPGIYFISAHFGGSSLYYEANSMPEVLSVIPTILTPPMR